MTTTKVLYVALALSALTSLSSAIDSPDADLVESTLGTWIRCSMEEEPTECVEERTLAQVREMRAELGWDSNGTRWGKALEMDEGNDADSGEVKILEAENKKMLQAVDESKDEGGGLFDEMAEYFAEGFLKIFDNDGPGDSTKANSTEARGHKKKYLKKQNKHLKIILILMLIKNKIKMFLHKFQFLVQLKFLAIAVANLLINLVRLWLELKKKHKPNKVIYYEKSHHQHHYDNEHIHDEPDDTYSYPTSYKHHAHHEEEYDGGGGIWPWSRSYVESHPPTYGNPHYFRPGNSISHNLAYMNQRPIR